MWAFIYFFPKGFPCNHRFISYPMPDRSSHHELRNKGRKDRDDRGSSFLSLAVNKIEDDITLKVIDHHSLEVTEEISLDYPADLKKKINEIAITIFNSC